MTHTKAQKFEMGNEVIDVNGNSKSTKFKVIDVNWYVSDDTFKRRDCWEYTCVNTGNTKVINFFYEWELKLSSEICEYEAYGNEMVGKRVKDVELSCSHLEVTFTDGSTSKFEFEGLNYGEECV